MFKVSVADTVKPPGLSPPDIAWSGTVGDFAPDSRHGLKAEQPIRSAILMLLFTDAACERAQLRPEHNGDRRGWVGDGFGVDAAKGEQPLGSTLWLLRRSKLDEKVAAQAEVEAVRALQPLIRQGLCSRVTATAAIAGARDRLELAIRLIGRDGRPVLSDRYDVLWKA